MTEEEKVGRALLRACTDLPEGWTIRIDLENGAGDIEISDSKGDILALDLSGEPFSDQINAHIDYAIEFVKESP